MENAFDVKESSGVFQRESDRDGEKESMEMCIKMRVWFCFYCNKYDKLVHIFHFRACDAQ